MLACGDLQLDPIRRVAIRSGPAISSTATPPALAAGTSVCEHQSSADASSEGASSGRRRCRGRCCYRRQAAAKRPADPARRARSLGAPASGAGFCFVADAALSARLLLFAPSGSDNWSERCLCRRKKEDCASRGAIDLLLAQLETRVVKPCLRNRPILRAVASALLSAIGVIPAAGWDKSGVPGPAWPVLSASESVRSRRCADQWGSRAEAGSGWMGAWHRFPPPSSLMHRSSPCSACTRNTIATPNGSPDCCGLSSRDGPVAVGTRGLEVRRIFGRQVAFPYVITEHEPPSRSAFRTLEGPLRPEGTATFTALERATSDGVFDWSSARRGRLRAVEPLLAPLFARQTQRDLERFKAWVQSALSADGRLGEG